MQREQNGHAPVKRRLAEMSHPPQPSGCGLHFPIFPELPSQHAFGLRAAAFPSLTGIEDKNQQVKPGGVPQCGRPIDALAGR
jgi:hypothetical protein